MSEKPYPSKVLTEVAEMLLDIDELTLAQIANLAADLPGECEAILSDRSERYWSEQSEPDDSSYRRDMIAAGRGHLLK